MDQVRFYYDRHWKSWGVRRFDADGNQVGDTVWTYTNAEARAEAEIMRKKIESEGDAQ